MNRVPLISPQNKISPAKVRRPSEKKSVSRSAARGLDVLETFGTLRRPLRAIEISRILKLHRSTTDQLLKTMVSSGHLVFEAKSKCYFPSPRLVGFAAWIVETYGAEEGLRNLIRDLHSRTGHMITLTTPNDLFMQVVDWAAGAGQSTERGLQISMFGSAIGSAYLSTLQNDALLRLISRARIPAREIPRILTTLEQIRRENLADGPSLDGKLWSLAVPLLGGRVQIPIVLGLAGPAEAVRSALDPLRHAMFDAIAHWRSVATAGR